MSKLGIEDGFEEFCVLHGLQDVDCESLEIWERDEELRGNGGGDGSVGEFQVGDLRSELAKEGAGSKPFWLLEVVVQSRRDAESMEVWPHARRQGEEVVVVFSLKGRTGVERDRTNT